MDEAAAARKLSRLEHHRSVGDELSFQMENLPEEIQPVVMSLLPLKEAVRTSIVARSWRMLWRFHTNLCFHGPNDLDYNSDEYDGIDEQAIDDFMKIKRAKFIEDVNWVLERHCGIGINKFSIRCGLHKDDFNHLDSWIRFAASSKAKIIEFDLKISNACPSNEVHHFPLEAFDVQGSSFVQSLFLADVSVKPHSDIRGFTMLRRLVLEYVKIFGDFPGLLANCSALGELEIIRCSGVTNLSIPHKLDKLHHLLIHRMDVEMIEFHAANLAYFEYKGGVIPVVLHGCSKLEKATICFYADKGLGHAFTAVPSILPVKILNVAAYIIGYEQLQKLPTRSCGVFLHLRHMTCQLAVLNSAQHADDGVLQLAYCLDIAPQLETLHLDDIMDYFDRLIASFEMQMVYLHFKDCKCDEVAAEQGSYMRRHDHLKTVYISGFRLYKAQTKLACCILANASVLEHLEITTRFGSGIGPMLNYGLMAEVCKWAHLASERFGKVITVLDASSE
ncbi:unnamed protein product [Alopecurus aequalis]